MSLLVMLTFCIFQPIHQASAALPAVLVPAIIAVFSLAAAVGINFAVNAIAGETPTAQNNIAYAILNNIETKVGYKYPLVSPLMNEIMVKDPERVTAPDPETGKSTFQMSKEEWIQTRNAWYEYIGSPYYNGTLPLEVEGNILYLDYTHSSNGLTHSESSSQSADLLSKLIYETYKKGVTIQLDTDYRIKTTWNLSGDEYETRRQDEFLLRYSYNSISKKFGLMTRNLTTGNESFSDVTVGVTYGKTLYGLNEVRLITLVNTSLASTAYNGIYIAINKDTNDTTVAKYALINALPNQGVTPISQSGELSDKKWWDIGNIKSGTEDDISTEVPYSVVPGITGTNKVLDNWNDAIALNPAAEDQPFTIDFETPDIEDYAPGAVMPGTLTADIDLTAQLEAEYELPDTDKPSLKAKFISVFPFCLPWDLKQAFMLLAAEPEAPYFSVDILAPVREKIGITGDTTITLDMDEYPLVGEVIRWTVLISFTIGLILVTRNIIKS